MSSRSEREGRVLREADESFRCEGLLTVWLRGGVGSEWVVALLRLDDEPVGTMDVGGEDHIASALDIPTSRF